MVDFAVVSVPCSRLLNSCCVFFWRVWYTQVTVAKQQLSDDRRHFDVVVACEDEDSEDLDVPLVSIRYK